MNAAETTAMLGSSETVEDWEKAFCDQVTGSGLFPGVKGCRILTTDSGVGNLASSSQVKVEDDSPSADDSYGRHKKHDKNKNLGKLTETLTTVYIATDEDSEELDSLALAFLEDDLPYAYNKVQEGKSDLQKGFDLQGVRSHYLGKAAASDDPEGDVLFPELSKHLRGSVGSWKYTG
jgi:hypothetical protein